MKQKEKEEAKRILPFFPLQSSILRRKKLQTRQRLTLTLTLSLTKYLQSLETKSTKKRERKKKKSLTITVLSSRFPIFIKTQIAITAQL